MRKMLSMNSSTSWPWSRKYSAIVSPDSPTRMRAPGGSFIWPNTSIVLSSTPDSFRSEEHTSELQSLRHLVCRLLLEKKKKKIIKRTTEKTKKHDYHIENTKRHTPHIKI